MTTFPSGLQNLFHFSQIVVLDIRPLQLGLVECPFYLIVVEILDSVNR
jgi:hypothetical protein